MTTLNWLAASLLLAAPVCVAADWRDFGDSGAKGDKYHMALDVESVRKQDGHVLAWVRVNHDKPQQVNGKEFRSSLMLYRIDCARQELATMQGSFHSGLNGRGSVISQHDLSATAAERMRPSAPESLGALAMKFGCVVAESR